MPYNNAGEFVWVDGHGVHYLVVECKVEAVATNPFKIPSKLASVERTDSKEGYDVFVCADVDGMEVHYNDSTGKLAILLLIAGNAERNERFFGRALRQIFEDAARKVDLIEDVIRATYPTAFFSDIKVYQQSGMKSQF